MALIGIALVARPLPGVAQNESLNLHCQLSQAEVDAKEALRRQTLTGDAVAIAQYGDLLKRHTDMLRSCRQRQWPRSQATWLRRYPCDLQPVPPYSLQINQKYPSFLRK